MPINIEDRYKLIFEEHRFASEFRAKIVQGWCLTYAAFAAAFAWVYANTPEVTYAVGLATLFSTCLMWAADSRHRAALKASKIVGNEIENDRTAAIPTAQRYFGRIRKNFWNHSLKVDLAAGFAVGFLAPSTCYLWKFNGRLSSVRPLAVTGCIVVIVLLVFGYRWYVYRKEWKGNA